MLGLFKRKRRTDDATQAKLVDAITSLLSVQLLILPNPALENSEGHINRKAVGYVYGYIDAFLRTRGYDMADSNLGVPITFHSENYSPVMTPLDMWSS